MSKKFFVFAGTDRFPSGGIKDLIGIVNDIRLAVRLADEECLSNFSGLKYDWAHVFNAETCKVECYRFADGYWNENDVWFSNLERLRNEP